MNIRRINRVVVLHEFHQRASYILDAGRKIMMPRLEPFWPNGPAGRGYLMNGAGKKAMGKLVRLHDPAHNGHLGRGEAIAHVEYYVEFGGLYSTERRQADWVFKKMAGSARADVEARYLKRPRPGDMGEPLEPDELELMRRWMSRIPRPKN